jgi:nicotinamidase-related amidase
MRILKESSTGLVIDIQERLFPVMDNRDEMLRKCSILLEGLRVLGIPVMVTEQYPRGLGATLQQVSDLISPFEPMEKIAFSCCGDAGFRSALQQAGPEYVIICGIEAHVCVLQTVIDLVEDGFKPVVVADCTSSRDPGDKAVAMDRMRDTGAVVTTCESILFELTREAGTDQFKSISKLVK